MLLKACSAICWYLCVMAAENKPGRDDIICSMDDGGLLAGVSMASMAGDDGKMTPHQEGQSV